MIGVLYETAFDEQRVRLVETARSQARLIESVARFDQKYSRGDHPEGAAAATMAQFKEAHAHYQGSGNTGENTLARRDKGSGPRRVTIRTSRAGEDAVEVAVEDTRPGIPALDTDGVFEPFFTTKAEGLGLGLAICTSIVESHGGQMRATSDGKSGTVFRLTLLIGGGNGHAGA